MTVPPQECACGGIMAIVDQFLLDHEATDPPALHATLDRLAALGVTLGDTVTVFRCPACQASRAIFGDA